MSDSESEYSASSLDDLSDDENDILGEVANDAPLHGDEAVSDGDALSNDDLSDDETESQMSDAPQLIQSDFRQSIVHTYYPELKYFNTKEVEHLVKVQRDKGGRIIDPLHKTIPILTKFEKAHILGVRSRQLEQGAQPFIDVPEDIVSTDWIAEQELRQKKIPFIIQRPLPLDGGSEFWSVSDLEFV